MTPQKDEQVADPPVVDVGIGRLDAISHTRRQDVRVDQLLEVDPQGAKGAHHEIDEYIRSTASSLFVQAINMNGLTIRAL